MKKKKKKALSRAIWILVSKVNILWDFKTNLIVKFSLTLSLL